MDSDKQVLTPEESRAFYIVKALAILGVIAAHVVPKQMTDYGPIYAILIDLWRLLAQTGVPVFLIASGFFFKRCQKGQRIPFVKNKFFALVIPWFVGAVFTFAVPFVLGDRSDAVMRFLRLFFGYGSLYYYMVILLAFYLLFNTLLTSHTGCLWRV